MPDIPMTRFTTAYENGQQWDEAFALVASCCCDWMEELPPLTPLIFAPHIDYAKKAAAPPPGAPAGYPQELLSARRSADAGAGDVDAEIKGLGDQIRELNAAKKASGLKGKQVDQDPEVAGLVEELLDLKAASAAGTATEAAAPEAEVAAVQRSASPKMTPKRLAKATVASAPVAPEAGGAGNDLCKRRLCRPPHTRALQYRPHLIY